jgi:hypothetical protein
MNQIGKDRAMIQYATRLGAAATLLALTGCDTVSVGDAVAAGVFDFISGTVTALLTSVLPVI